MSIVVDEAGVLVDSDGWAALLSGEASQEDLEQVHAVSGASYAVAAGRKPVALIELEISTPTGVYLHLGWVAHEAVALLVDRGDGQHRLISVPPDHLAVSLARLTGLGPRPATLREAHPARQSDLDDWFAEDEHVRSEALDHLGSDRAWRMTVSPVGPLDPVDPHESGPDDVMMMALADGPGGAWLVEPSGAEPLLEPVSPTWIYTAFAGLLLAL